MSDNRNTLPAARRSRRFAWFIALRYLFAGSGRAFISVISWLSVAGVALGTAALIVIMAVMNGFTTDLRDKIIGVTAHAVVFGARNDAYTPDRLEAVKKIPGVIGATPFVYSELMLSSSSGFKGVVLRGVDPVSAPSVLGALSKMTEGSAADLASEEGLPGIVVGIDLARKLGLYIGARVNLLAPSGKAGAAGFTPVIKPHRVVGIFSIGLFEYDSSMAFVSLEDARRLLGMPENAVTGLEIAVNDVYKAKEISAEVVNMLGPSMFYARTWMDMNSNLFAALALEKAAMAVILTLIILVGSFSIITSQIMLVMEKTRDIAVLMSMGATRRDIRGIFVGQGLVIGAMGTGIGLALGLFICFLLGKYQFIKLPEGVYSLDYLPILLEWSDIAFTCVGAMILCFLATLYPAHQASRLEPVEALRHE